MTDRRGLQNSLSSVTASVHGLCQGEQHEQNSWRARVSSWTSLRLPHGRSRAVVRRLTREPWERQLRPCSHYYCCGMCCLVRSSQKADGRFVSAGRRGGSAAPGHIWVARCGGLRISAPWNSFCSVPPTRCAHVLSALKRGDCARLPMRTRHDGACLVFGGRCHWPAAANWRRLAWPGLAEGATARSDWRELRMRSIRHL